MQTLYQESEKNKEQSEFYRGLSSAEVEESQRKHGKNIMSRAKKKSFLARFISNLGDPVVKILIVALIVNLLFALRGQG